MMKDREEVQRLWTQIVFNMRTIIEDHKVETGEEIDVDLINEFMDDLGEDMKDHFGVE